MLVGFGATANHCAFYLMSSSTVAAHEDHLSDYDTSKGTIRFQADKPLPVALVRKLVKARIAENAGRRRNPKQGEALAPALIWHGYGVSLLIANPIPLVRDLGDPRRPFGGIDTGPHPT
jgi:hypothetical protein